MVRSILQIGKVQLLCEEMMQLGVDMGTLKTRDHEKYGGGKCGPYHRGGKGRTGKHGNIIHQGVARRNIINRGRGYVRVVLKRMCSTSEQIS